MTLRVSSLIGVALVLAACNRAADATHRIDTTAASHRPDSVTPAESTVAPAPSPVTAATMTVTPFGIGPLRAGMSLDDASAALGGKLVVPTNAAKLSCGYARWRGGPAGVRVMIGDGAIARIDVDSGATATNAGARIGDSEERVRSLYGSNVTVTPAKYTNGHYLTVTPAAPADSAYRIVFEAEHDRVTKYRAGRRPAVEYVEGCG